MPSDPSIVSLNSIVLKQRFEHKYPDKPPQKLDAAVRFPAVLNMAPYTTLSLEGGDQTQLGPAGMYEYDLFTVVNHEGQIDNGHYTNFARIGDDVCGSNIFRRISTDAWPFHSGSDLMTRSALPVQLT